VSDTVNAALAETARRPVLDGFDVVRDIDGTPDDVDANRRPQNDRAAE